MWWRSWMWMGGSDARQLRRAGASVPLNIADGNQRKGADRLHHFRISAGSAAEVTAAIEVAVAFGYVELAAADNALSLLDRVRALLYRQR